MKFGPSTRFTILVAALAFTACPPADQNNTGGGAGGGVFGGGGGGSAVTGGGSAVTGGGSAVTGGGSAVTGGGSAVTGGGSAVTGGGDGTTGGGTAVTGGGDGTTGGGTAVTGGGDGTTGGGTSAVTGGGTAGTGGGTATGTLCDGATPLTSGQVVNDTTDGANNTFAFADQNGCQGSSSAIDGTAGDKLYVITVPPDMAITASLTTDWDSTFNLIAGTAACGTPVGVGDDPTTACVAGRDDPDDAPLFWVNNTGASVEVYLLVDAYSSASGDFTLSATIGPGPVCGNGTMEISEACDDGNTTDGDGCSAVCELEFGAVCTTASPSVCQPAGETCSNAVTLDLNGSYTSSTASMAADINGNSGVDGCAPNDGADSVFLLSLPPSAYAEVVFSQSNASWESILNIVEGLATCQASSLVCVDSAYGDYTFTLSNPASATANREIYLIVDGYSAGNEGPFTLNVTTVIPVCGDGVTSGAETCDDSNLLDGDGCDSNCTTTACGNGVVTSGEVCDDANSTNGDGCDTNCTVTACGNGIQTGSELCDDGNVTSGDGCSATCDFTGEAVQVSSIAVTGLPAGYFPGWGFVVENGQFVITITNSVDGITQGTDAGGIGSVPLDGGAYAPIFAENQTQGLDPQVIFYSAGRLFAFNGIFSTVNGVGGLYEFVSGTPTARSTAPDLGAKYGWSWSADNFYFAQYTPSPYGIYGANGSATTPLAPIKVENIPSSDWGGPFGVVVSSSKLYAFDSTQNLKVWSLDGAVSPAVAVTTGTPSTMTAPTDLCGWNDRLAIALDDPAAPTRIFYTVWGQPASSTSSTVALGRICQIALDASGEPTGAPTVFAGPSTETAGSIDGPRLGSTFEAVLALTFDTTSQKLYVLQRSNSVTPGSVIRAITP